MQQIYLSRISLARHMSVLSSMNWVISLAGLVLSLSGITTCTHRPQGVIIVGTIYMSSNIYYYYT